MSPRSLAAVLAVIAAGCGGSPAPPQPTPARPAQAPAPPRPTPARPAKAPRPPAAAAPMPRLTGARKCPDIPDATCSTLPVALDRSGARRGTLRLRVAVAGPRDAPVLVVLGGGPGQPGASLISRARQWLGPVAGRLRLVGIDQRGTGRGALRCPALQRAMGASDLTPPPAAAVRACAERIGPSRRFFTTADTVADLEALRVALHARRIALDGVSYGTYVAQRYALAHPRHVSRLVLDSVVPAGGVSLLSTVPIKATVRVLGNTAAADLAAVVKARQDGPQLLDMLTSMSIGSPRANRAANALRRARRGNFAPLEGLQRAVRRATRSWTARALSQGLHSSTLCADSRAPWGDASAPLAGRRAALDRAVAELSPADLYPYDRETAAGNGIARTCLHWPPVPVPKPAADRDLPAVPVLLLAGDRDLSTPVEWARQAARRAARGRLMVVKGAGHSVQTQRDPAVLRAVRGFVASLAPCSARCSQVIAARASRR